jgi:hypothetical protein
MKRNNVQNFKKLLIVCKRTYDTNLHLTCKRTYDIYHLFIKKNRINFAN